MAGGSGIRIGSEGLSPGEDVVPAAVGPAVLEEIKVRPTPAQMDARTKARQLMLAQVLMQLRGGR